MLPLLGKSRVRASRQRPNSTTPSPGLRNIPRSGLSRTCSFQCQRVTNGERDLPSSPTPRHPSHVWACVRGRTQPQYLCHAPTQQGDRLGASLLPWIKMLEKTTSLKQFNTGQKRHILICTAMHLGHKFTQHNWKKKSKLCFYTYSMVSASFLATYLSLHLWMLLYTHTNKQLRHECSFRLPSSSNKVQTCIASYATQP